MAKRPELSLFKSNSKPETQQSLDPTFFMPDVAAGRTLVEIPHERISPDPNQPRSEWTSDDLDELQSRVEPAGRLLQPITVRENPDLPGFYIIKTGEGRWRVTGPDRLAWPTVTCIIESSDMEADSQDVYANQILENIGKIAMRPLQLAQAIEKWMHGFDGKVKNGREAAKKFGLSETAISRYRKLLSADGRIQALSGRLTNINTLTSLIDLSRMSEVHFEKVLTQIELGTLPNAERYLQQLVTDLKKPPKKAELESASRSDDGDGDGDGDSEQATLKPITSKKLKNKRESAEALEQTITPTHLQRGWVDKPDEDIKNIQAVDDLEASELDGFAVLQFTVTGKPFTLKLTYEQQLQLRWLLDKAAENQ